MVETKDLVGNKYNRLKVIGRAPDYVSPRGKKEAMWFCECECGNKNNIVSGTKLKHGYIKSCGCLIKDNTRMALKKYNSYDLTGKYGIGYTANGEEFYFDLEDYDLIKNYSWYSEKNGGYTKSKVSNKNIFFHKVVTMTIDNGDFVIDHINRKRNDNRKLNLRKVTKQQNTFNISLPSNNTSGYIGVSYSNRRNKWESYIKYNSKRYNLGRYKNKNEAIKSRLMAEIKYFGKEYAPQRHLFEEYLGENFDENNINIS